MINKTINEKSFYRTADLALSSAISLFYPIESIDRQNPKKAQFIFKQDKGLNELIDNYWKGQIKIEPQAYFNALRIIKARLYGEE